MGGKMISLPSTDWIWEIKHAMSVFVYVCKERGSWCIRLFHDEYVYAPGGQRMVRSEYEKLWK